jgi:hypothetical protein
VTYITGRPRDGKLLGNDLRTLLVIRNNNFFALDIVSKMRIYFGASH